MSGLFRHVRPARFAFLLPVESDKMHVIRKVFSNCLPGNGGWIEHFALTVACFVDGTSDSIELIAFIVRNGGYQILLKILTVV